MGATVALVSCASYDRAEVEDAFARALELLGGAERFFPKGARVLVKPNLLYATSRERRVTTDPEVVGAAVRAAEPFAGDMAVGDSPGFGSSVRAARVSGYAGALEGTRARLVNLAEPVELRALSFPRIEIAREAASADVLVNAAKLKTHPLTGLTLAVKNLFGCVPGTRKAAWHLKAGDDASRFARVLVEVAYAANARLHVLDAIVGMEGNGPGSGTPRQVGALLVSDDAVALDRVACDLVSFPSEAVVTLEAARRLGWGESDLKRIEIVGDDIKALRVRNYTPAVSHGLGRVGGRLRRLAKPIAGRMLPRPEFDGEICRSCDICVEACPTGCLLPREGRAPARDRKKCIRCFVCQELCPHGAVRTRSGWLGRFLR